LTPDIQEIMERLLDQIEDPASFDVMQAIAQPLSVLVLAKLLGVPPEDWVRLAGWSHRVAARSNLRPVQLRIRTPCRPPMTSTPTSMALSRCSGRSPRQA